MTTEHSTRSNHGYTKSTRLASTGEETRGTEHMQEERRRKKTREAARERARDSLSVETVGACTGHSMWRQRMCRTVWGLSK